MILLLSPNDSFNFLRDVLPTLISGVAIVISVLMPYLLIRYEKVYQTNKEYKDFLRLAEIYFLDWLNVTSYNLRLTEEFLEVINDKNAVFPKDFQFYDFPTIEFFKTYNNELLNEFYMQVRRLKEFDNHLRAISAEYTVYKRMRSSRDAIQPQNGNDFFIEALTSMKEQYPKAEKEINNLRAKVRLLLKEVNKISSITVGKFFNFNPNGVLWYRKDLGFTEEEVKAEESNPEVQKQKRTE